MNKSTVLKSAFQLLSLLICLVFIPAAYAQPDELTGSVAENVTCENYTAHAIDPIYDYICVMPGDSKTVDVRFRNEGSEAINVAPKVVDSSYSFNVLDKSWIRISPANVTVEPSMEQEFEVEVNVPEDAESGEYEARIVFTDDVYSYECEDPEYIVENAEPDYVNVMSLGISVPVRPKLELQTSYVSDTMEPGKEYVYEIKIKNVAGKDVTIDPEMTERYDYCGAPYSESAFSDDIIEISAPSTIKAGEIANMTIRIPVPENASGTYSGLIEMNADGNEYDGSVPQINLDFTVLKQPSIPYVKTFTTTTADPITITVTTDSYFGSSVRVSPKQEEPSLDVSLKCNSNPVNMNLVETTQNTYVYSQWYNFPIWAIEDDSDYESNNQHVETYKVSGAVGTWELKIIPENANGFSYSITVGDYEKKLK